jgi:hypothetical protein
MNKPLLAAIKIFRWPMNNRRVFAATLHMADIEDFFTIPTISPFSSDFREHSHTSGIEYLAKELYASPSVKEVRVTLLLPPDKIRPGLQQQAQEALLRYCGGRIRCIEQDTRGLRRHALRALLLAIVGMIICIGLGSELTYSASFLIRLLGQGLIVLGWVFVWFPLDSIFFGPQYYQLDPGIYKRLMQMQLTLKGYSAIDVVKDGQIGGEDIKRLE